MEATQSSEEQEELNCFTRPDGSTYYGYPDGISTPNNLPETWCTGAGSKPLEPPEPPSITTEIDTPSQLMPPIALTDEEEEPEPVDTSQPTSGMHPPISTGIEYGEEAHPPYSYPPEPTEEELRDCPRGSVWAAPGDTCPPNMSRTIPGSDCCFPNVSTYDRKYTSMVLPNLFDGGGVSAVSLTGRRTYPVVNLGRRGR
jgi:hypothetical protein